MTESAEAQNEDADEAEAKDITDAASAQPEPESTTDFTYALSDLVEEPVEDTPAQDGATETEAADVAVVETTETEDATDTTDSVPEINSSTVTSRAEIDKVMRDLPVAPQAVDVVGEAKAAAAPNADSDADADADVSNALLAATDKGEAEAED